MPLRRGYIDARCGQLHYYEQGRGPPLVLLPQAPASGRLFEKAMRFLAAANFRAIAIDTPGFGMSDVPASPPTISEYADNVYDFLVGFGIEKAHFLGHHTGAMIAANLAVRWPENVISVILNGPPLLTQSDLKAFADIKPGPEPKFADGSHLIRAWERRTSFTPGWRDVEIMHRRLVDQLSAGDTAWYGHHAAFAHDFRSDFLAVSQPAMILTNTGDDLYAQAKTGRQLRPDFAYVELEGGTHDIVDEFPERWSASVTSFLDQQEAQ